MRVCPAVRDEPRNGAALGRAVAFGLAVLAAAPAAGVEALTPTPLILKDGRVAEVAVHRLAFDAGATTPDGGTEEAIRRLLPRVATDCFLSAQVIGHVGSGERDGAARAAQELARGRADTVQARLVAAGLPARAIASVWDWRFLIDAPGTTLWVFRLAPGETCADAPLTAAVAAVTLRVRETTASADSALPPPDAVATVPVPRPRPGRRNRAASSTFAAADAAGGGRAEVAFAANSSFLPDDAGRTLEGLLAGAGPTGRYRVDLASGVVADDVRGAASADEAERYNRWLAARRVDRVRAWLSANAGSRVLDFTQRFSDDDAGRVTVTLGPAG